jgi:AcrR family transcriptional regulator
MARTTDSKTKAPGSKDPGAKSPKARRAGIKDAGTRPRRSAGRPSKDDRDLRAHLLDVAIARFSRDGIGATSLRAIAADAGVTPAMLHYYFGDKAQLKQALIEERLLPALMAMRGRLEQAGDDPAALVAGFVRGMQAVIAQHPWLPPLWVREVLCEGGELRGVLFDRMLVPSLPQLLADRFAAAQAAGRLNPALDPRLLVVSLVGLTLFPAAGAPIWQRVFGAGDLGHEAMFGHALALLGQGIGAKRTEGAT